MILTYFDCRVCLASRDDTDTGYCRHICRARHTSAGRSLLYNNNTSPSIIM